MVNRSNLAAVNDFLHAAIVCAVLAVSALGLSDELAGIDGKDVLAVAVSAVEGASVAYAATLTQPPVLRRA